MVDETSLRARDGQMWARKLMRCRRASLGGVSVWLVVADRLRDTAFILSLCDAGKIRHCYERCISRVENGRNV